jgi:hypothetical protein
VVANFSYKIWFDSILRKEIRKHDRLRKKYLLIKNDSSKELYKRLNSKDNGFATSFLTTINTLLLIISGPTALLDKTLES